MTMDVSELISFYEWMQNHHMDIVNQYNDEHQKRYG